METVEIEKPRRMNLLGLMLGDVLTRSVARRGPDGLGGLAGDVVVEAGRMAITLRFEEGRVLVKRGAKESARARLSGSLNTLLNMALGGGMVWPLLTRRLRIGGNPFVLLKLRSLLRVPGETVHRRQLTTGGHSPAAGDAADS